MMRLECNPHDNDMREDECTNCHDDGREDCPACGGEEPWFDMPPNEDILATLYSLGAVYDSRRSGPSRTLHLHRCDGVWEAEWRNGPFDHYRVEVEGDSATGAVAALVRAIETIDMADHEADTVDTAAE